MDPSKRLHALDVFRGITIAAMMLVNMPGSWSYVYAPLSHAAWHGCTPTDLIFPFFLFAIGISMWFAFKRFDYKLDKQVLIKIFRRSILIFLIGLSMNAFPFIRDYANLRIMAVLQRIAIAYFFSSMICLSVKPRGLPAVAGGILLAYWGILLTGGPDPYSLENNVVGIVDRALLGAGHLYQGYGIPFDPEGLLSSLPGISQIIIGFLVGKMISQNGDRKKLILKMAAAGLLQLIVGRIWHEVMPMNKALWTSSYVVYTSGWAFVFLALLIYIIDHLKWKKWIMPFTVFGMNPLFSYVLSQYLLLVYWYFIYLPGPDGKMLNANDWLFERVFVPIAGHMNGSLLFAVTHLFIIWIAAFILYRKNIFIKI